MKAKYLIVNLNSGKALPFPNFKEAEQFAILACSKDPELVDVLVLSRVSHRIIKVDSHFESEFLHKVEDLDGYEPQKGDSFRKIKSFRSGSGLERFLIREILEVQGDYVLIKNVTGNDKEPSQLMPVRQWKKWIVGAEFIKKAGELLCDL